MSDKQDEGIKGAIRVAELICDNSESFDKAQTFEELAELYLNVLNPKVVITEAMLRAAVAELKRLSTTLTIIAAGGDPNAPRQ